MSDVTKCLLQIAAIAIILIGALLGAALDAKSKKQPTIKSADHGHVSIPSTVDFTLEEKLDALIDDVGDLNRRFDLMADDVAEAKRRLKI